MPQSNKRLRPPPLSLLRRRLRASAHAQLDAILDGPSGEENVQTVLGACVARALAGGVSLRVNLHIETPGTGAEAPAAN